MQKLETFSASTSESASRDHSTICSLKRFEEIVQELDFLTAPYQGVLDHVTQGHGILAPVVELRAADLRRHSLRIMVMRAFGSRRQNFACTLKAGANDDKADFAQHRNSKR